MNTTTLQALNLTCASQADTLTPQQQAFNQLVADIALKKQRLQAWQQMSERYRQVFIGEYQPQLATLSRLQLRLLQQFNLAYDDKRLSGAERRELSRVICQIAETLPDGDANDEVRMIVAMHSDKMPEPAPRTNAAPTTIHAQTEPTQEALAPWEQAALERERQKQQRQTRRKQARADKAAQHLQQAVQEATRSLREVYRKLASQLHPDREQDEAEQARKTGLMQRANQAYADRDLLKLLELQLETAQIDPQHLQTLNDERLQHYSRILHEQLSDLDEAIREIVQSFGLAPPAHGRPPHAPDDVLRALTRHCRRLQQDIATLTRQLPLFSEPQQIIRWLNSRDA